MQRWQISVTILVLLGLLSGPALAATGISGVFTTGLATDFREPYRLQGENELELSLRRNFGDAGLFVGLLGAHSWPADHPWQLEIDEAYIDYYAAAFDLRLGRQRISWGTALEINPTSVLNPPNMKDPLGDKLPIYALKMDYYLNNVFSLTGVYVPFFTPAVREVPIPGIEVRQPDPIFENGEAALKLSARGLGGYDFSLSYFYGREDLPTVVMGQPPYAHYRPMHVFGLDMATVFGDVGFWLEGVYNVPKDGAEYYQGIVGADYGFSNGIVVMGQYLHQKNKLGEVNNLLILGSNQDLGLYQWRLGMIYNLDEKSYMLRPEVSFSLSDVTKIMVGGNYFGPEGGSIGLLPVEQNQLYAKMQISF